MWFNLFPHYYYIIRRRTLSVKIVRRRIFLTDFFIFFHIFYNFLWFYIYFYIIFKSKKVHWLKSLPVDKYINILFFTYIIPYVITYMYKKSNYLCQFISNYFSFLRPLPTGDFLLYRRPCWVLSLVLAVFFIILFR